MYCSHHHQTAWLFFLILLVLALLLALIPKPAYGTGDFVLGPTQDRADQSRRFWRMAAADGSEQFTPSELWFRARELYVSGRYAESRLLFERVVRTYAFDPGARLWAGMAALRCGDREAAIRHWEGAYGEEGRVSLVGVWPAIGLAQVHIEVDRPDLAARYVIPLERGDSGPTFADHPVVTFYAARVYESLAQAAPRYMDAVEESLAERFTPATASRDGRVLVSPASKAWLVFLTKQALLRTIRGAGSLDWAAPVVPEGATAEPSLAPTVGEMLEALGSADFAATARQTLRALRMYQSPPDRKIEFFDDPESMRRHRFVA